jgi:glycosyltransferase involved in cell wall biosynthesis
MTTLHITNAYQSRSGRIRTFYDALLEAANREGRRVVLVVPGRRSEIVDVGVHGRIYFLKAACALSFTRRHRLILPHGFVPGLTSQLVQILERERPAVIEICDRYLLPWLAATLRKGWHPRVCRPTLVSLACERFDEGAAAFMTRRAGRAFTQWYIRHVYGPMFDAHIAISEDTAAELRAALADRPGGFVRVARFGVDIRRYTSDRRNAAVRGRLLRQAGGDSTSVLLFYAGRLVPEKNIGLLVEMVHELVQIGHADYRLLIAGDGPLAGWIRAQRTGPLAGRIHWCSAPDSDALASYYANCDVFVYPHAGESVGTAPLEAMASGVPVVFANRGGVREYASELNAWLAIPDARSFASAVTAARGGDPDRTRRALQTAHRFRWSQVTSEYFSLYDELDARFRASRAAAGTPVSLEPEIRSLRNAGTAQGAPSSTTHDLSV